MASNRSILTNLNGTNTTANDYVYDVNGNLTQDLNKGINTMTYNHLNLAVQVEKDATHYIDYHAGGSAKFQKVVNNGGINTTTDYTAIGNYIDGSLDFIFTPEGRIVDDAGTWRHEYFYKDHLGNTRLAFSDMDSDQEVGETEILQQHNYYPFGLEHKGTLYGLAQQSAHKYLYNGKELQDELGINWMDFGARNYDASVGRWFNVDPLAEQMRRHSPYNYAFDNPIYFIDPDGMAAGDFYNEFGKHLGSDGKEDGKVYVMKTDQSSFGEGNTEVSGAGLSKSDKKEAKNFVKDNDGNTSEFDKNKNIYKSFIEVEGKENRQAMVDIVNADDGSGGTNVSNNREYGGTISDGDEVKESSPCPVTDPSKQSEAFITHTVNSKTKTTFHSHPSGTVVKTPKSNGSASSTTIGGTTTTYSFIQHPSSHDINNSGNTTKYVFGRGDGNVYIYNGNGVQAVMRMKDFLKMK